VKFLVFGAGGLGSLVGGLLSQRHSVVLVGRREHVKAIARRGLRITGRTEAIVRPVAVEDVSGADTPDVILVTVKAYDTPRAVEALEPFWKTSTFLSLQNGLGNEDLLASKAEKVLGGVTNQGVTFLGPGEVHHAGAGETYIGPYKGTTEADAVDVVEAFRECGMPCSLAKDIRRELWLKAVVNACINPLTGLLGVRNGYLQESEELRDLVRRIVSEGVHVAEAHGISLQQEDVLERVWYISSATADNKSSMLQDLERGRRTEVDAINGEIVRTGRRLGISCEVNAFLVSLVKAAEGAPRLR
jgi:2-dehydropantoate 2-reductase